MVTAGAPRSGLPPCVQPSHRRPAGQSSPVRVPQPPKGSPPPKALALTLSCLVTPPLLPPLAKTWDLPSCPAKITESMDGKGVHPCAPAPAQGAGRLGLSGSQTHTCRCTQKRVQEPGRRRVAAPDLRTDVQALESGREQGGRRGPSLTGGVHGEGRSDQQPLVCILGAVADDDRVDAFLLDPDVPGSRAPGRGGPCVRQRPTPGQEGPLQRQAGRKRSDRPTAGRPRPVSAKSRPCPDPRAALAQTSTSAACAAHLQRLPPASQQAVPDTRLGEARSSPPAPAHSSPAGPPPHLLLPNL